MSVNDSPSHSIEAQRVREAYATELRMTRAMLYAWHRPEIGWTTYRMRAVAAKLIYSHFGASGPRSMLEIGCGTAPWVRTAADWGFAIGAWNGIDLLPDRIATARQICPGGANLLVGNGMALPFEDNSIDLVVASTVFSSILDRSVRMSVASEAWRVLRPGGAAMIFDFRIKDPRNPDTVAIGRSELVRLFPASRPAVRSLILVPPLARRLASASLPLVAMLEWGVPWLRSHLMTLFIKDPGPV